MTPWVYLRVALILAAAVSACLSPLGPRATSPIGWGTLTFVFAFFSLGLVPILALQRFNRWSAPTWHRPSWKLNPFSIREPLQFFHLCSWVFLTQGAITLGRLLSSSASFYAEALVPLTMGASTFLGIRLSMLVFKSKMASGI